MSNGWKTGRVAQVFGVQVQNKFPREQIHFCLILTVVHFHTEFCIFLLSYCYGVSDILLYLPLRWS
jgi:hypothetical protein